MIKGSDLIALGYAKNIETETTRKDEFTYTETTYVTMTKNMYVAATVEGLKDRIPWPRDTFLAPKNARVIIRQTEISTGMVKYTHENNYYFYDLQK